MSKLIEKRSSSWFPRRRILFGSLLVLSFAICLFYLRPTLEIHAGYALYGSTYFRKLLSKIKGLTLPKEVENNGSAQKIAHFVNLAIYAAGACQMKDGSLSKHECGEDAYTISASRQSSVRSFFAVADGVGGWGEKGGDSSIISRELLKRVEDIVLSTKLSVKEATTLAFARMANAGIYKLGSTTFCGAAYDSRTGTLDVANVGDSAAFVVRKGVIVAKTRIGLEGFNAPHQLGFDGNGAPYGSVSIQASTLTLSLEPQDILILASDGILDNLYDDELLQTVHALLPFNSARIMSPMIRKEALVERLQTASSALVWLARARSKETLWKSPFGANAASYGFMHAGGKHDDVSIIIAIFEAET